jgi:hypothetical protein
MPNRYDGCRADGLFAQLPTAGQRRVTCETGNGILEASTAAEIYDPIGPAVMAKPVF